MSGPCHAMRGIYISTLAVVFLFCASSHGSDIGSGRLLLPNPEFPPRVCFTITRSAVCEAKFQCCNGAQGVTKIEFDVVSSCRPSLQRVTVNKQPWGSYEFNGQLSVLRVTKLDLTPATAPGTQICFFLQSRTPCPNIRTLCTTGDASCTYAIFNIPSPPPPPPPRPYFANCSCVRDPVKSQLFVYPDVVVVPARERGYTKMCFTIGTLDVCNSRSRCCQFDLYKAEFEATPDCIGSLAYMTVNGVERSRFFQLTPYPAIKVTNLNKRFDDVEGTEICLVLKTSDCGSLTKLGKFRDGTLAVALFNRPDTSGVDCCPVSIVDKVAA
ncbi:extracellular matrix glycoprotein pherophorin-V26 [Volvox carteri f. nagariensis]|uniref:Extracellular matrix glycoprotein pherophorin-V26 n=1 Tax=Volvox carteri f. nagariensis TaxID=3068 RepID=D8UER2_VOLCA|nr:extracellular matrix glycoprotein pherophorin-V26 [Volvox carteri f. nagariensis]EFJ41814.1 extracellular matrix glycoprotein pherophorin-V26 [Volvox carteri f. nagariensis]|eukprot:XP_002957160.1 extracellular matrix glycoprotein pherophorin-V26 [Volvox carteri f. nagariensis]